MAATKRTTKRKPNPALAEALQRAEAMKQRDPRVEIWKHSETHVLVYFGSEENAYLYEVPTSDEGRKLHWVPGRAVLSVDRRDASLEEFRTICERLV